MLNFLYIFSLLLCLGMRVACKLGREVLDEAARVCDVGVTTDDIDRAVHEACIERDCYPSPLNYYEFPKSCCTSVNEVGKIFSMFYNVRCYIL